MAAAILFSVSNALWPPKDPNDGLPAAVSLGFWVIVTMVASASPIHVPRGSVVSVAAAPIVAAAMLGGPSFAAVVAVVGPLELRELRGSVPWYGLLYNHSSIVFPAVFAGIA